MQAAFDEIADSGEHNFGKMVHSVSHGALMGARGNSGVILSQLWRGFARAVDSKATLDVPTMVQAFAAARDTAYKGVVRPVEGTILTVAKDIAAAADASQASIDDPGALLEILVIAADRSVQRTPNYCRCSKTPGWLILVAKVYYHPRGC
jgi:dihydroxyacetone kinase-like predicted kinase